MPPLPFQPNAAPRPSLLTMRHRLLAIAATSSALAGSYACGGSDSDNAAAASGMGGTSPFLLAPNLPGGAGGTNGSSSATCRASGIPTLADGAKTYQEGFASREEARKACPAECGVIQSIVAYSCSKAWDITLQGTYSCNCMGPFCTEDQGKAVCADAETSSRQGYKARAVNFYGQGSGTEVDAPGWYCLFNEVSNHPCGRPCYVDGVALLAPLVRRRDWGAA